MLHGVDGLLLSGTDVGGPGLLSLGNSHDGAPPNGSDSCLHGGAGGGGGLGSWGAQVGLQGGRYGDVPGESCTD